MNRTTILLAVAVAALAAAAMLAPHAPAQQARPAFDRAKSDAAMSAAFKAAPADWQPRLSGDATMQACSASRNSPAAAEAKAIEARERASIKYPADGVLVGDWKKGEALAQNGYGMRFTDYPAARENGGNCYACHELTKQEVSFGTMGPSLREYGKIRKFAPADTKAVYDKIYNPHVAFPCSLMPRFGTGSFLTIEQIKHLVALLMDPESPVNK
jgi:sulfur-oxidizing protein SoxX